jgi:hypothetical protein
MLPRTESIVRSPTGRQIGYILRTADDWEPLPNLRRILGCLPDGRLLVAERLNHFAAELYPEAVLGLVR